uniref:Semaphorin-2A n=1 Tax=Octopus bimaculoides TaxID=37653 RepID=A0A0L8G6D4_OCTBM
MSERESQREKDGEVDRMKQRDIERESKNKWEQKVYAHGRQILNDGDDDDDTGGGGNGGGSDDDDDDEYNNGDAAAFSPIQSKNERERERESVTERKPKVETSLNASTKSAKRCVWQAKKKMPDCQNHIRLIARNGTTLLVCGTGAYQPTTYHLDIDTLELKSSEPSPGLCAFDPFDNSTAILVHSKTSEEDLVSIYSGTFADFSKARPQIYRPSVYTKDGKLAYDYLKTAPSSSKWLNEPQFVASFNTKDQVLFFLRELAVEYGNCGKKIYSRVARVCKNDRGGERLLINEWSTYLKARINCSLPGQYPYYFDEIQDVYTQDNKIFYGLFTTNRNGITASAICAYHWTDIQKVFDGPFKDQNTDTSYWLPVANNQVPAIRPGNCSINDSRSLPDNVLTFIKDKPLMHMLLQHMYSTPIFHKADVMLQKLTMAFNVSGRNDVVFFAASNQGKVYKIFQRPMENARDKPYAVVSAVYSPFSETQPIWNMVMHKDYLYLSTDSKVLQVNVETCEQYKKADACINDPYCGWARNDKCMPYNQGSSHHRLRTFKDVPANMPFKEAMAHVIEEPLYESRTVNVSVGTSFRLRLSYKICVEGPVKWKKNETLLCPGNEYLMAQDNSLILQNIHIGHQGHYQAEDRHNAVVSQYTVNIRKGKEDIEKDWMLKFQEWCDLFEDYKRERDKWTNNCHTGNADINSNTINAIPQNRN